MNLFGFFKKDKDVDAQSAEPASPVAPKRARSIQMRTRAIDGGESGRLTSTWKATNLSSDEEISRNLETTRARSRDLYYNNEYAKKYFQMVGTHIVGPSGFNLQSLANDKDGNPDSAARAAIEKEFWKWSQAGICEVTKKLSFIDLQRQLIVAIARDGEALVMRKRDRKYPYGYALKLIEIDRLPVKRSWNIKNSAGRVVMGVELDAEDCAVAYHLNMTRNLDSMSMQNSQLKRVPAEDILHVYISSRAEQRRGLPWPHAVMLGMKMLGGYEEAAIVAARVGAAKMGFFTLEDDGDPAPLAEDQDENGEFYTDAAPGEFGVLPKGYKFESWDPDYPHQGYEAFVKARLRAIAAGLGIAYHTLANDLSDVNFSSARSGTIEERDNWMVLQNWFSGAFLQPLFLDWLECALKKGAIRLPNGSPLSADRMADLSAHVWQGRRWQWVDPLKDIESARLAIKTGISSPQIIAAQSGVDVEDVLAQIAAYEAMLDKSKVQSVDLKSSAKPAPDVALQE